MANPDWWGVGDEMNAINRCPPWLRGNYNYGLDAADSPLRQGVALAPADDGTQLADWGAMAPTACDPRQAVGGFDCHSQDYVYLQNTLPDRIVSGSRVLYGPVGISTCSYLGGQPKVTLSDTEVYWCARARRPAALAARSTARRPSLCLGLPSGHRLTGERIPLSSLAAVASGTRCRKARARGRAARW